MKRRNFLQGMLGAAAGLFGSVAVAKPAPVKKYPVWQGVDLAGDAMDRTAFFEPTAENDSGFALSVNGRGFSDYDVRVGDVVVIPDDEKDAMVAQVYENILNHELRYKKLVVDWEDIAKAHTYGDWD